MTKCKSIHELPDVREYPDARRNLHTNEEMGDISKEEDLALKVFALFFAQELVPRLGIKGKVVSICPTELVDIKLSNFYQDFNFSMDDGTWKHFEFESGRITRKKMKRFRSYEAVASYQYNKEITTYVLCSGGMKKPRKKLKTGINTYRIIPIMMKEKDAGALIQTLKKKEMQGKAITKEDLVWLTPTPLMGGGLPQKDRFLSAYELIEKSQVFQEDEKEQIQAVLYVMANKFLDGKNLKKLKEAMRMLPLGKMLRDEGIREGRSQGLLEGRTSELVRITRKNMEKGIPYEKVAEFLNLDSEKVGAIYHALREKPDLTDLEIARTLFPSDI